MTINICEIRKIIRTWKQNARKIDLFVLIFSSGVRGLSVLFGVYLKLSFLFYCSTVSTLNKFLVTVTYSSPGNVYHIHLSNGTGSS